MARSRSFTMATTTSVVVRTPGVASRRRAWSLRIANAAIISGSPSSRTAESIAVRSMATEAGTSNQRRKIANRSSVTSCSARSSSGLGIVSTGSSLIAPGGCRPETRFARSSAQMGSERQPNGGAGTLRAELELIRQLSHQRNSEASLEHQTSRPRDVGIRREGRGIVATSFIVDLDDDVVSLEITTHDDGPAFDLWLAPFRI